MLSVNGPGISDPLLFDTVISIPSDPDIGNDQTVGGVSGETLQLNVADGGVVGNSFEIGRQFSALADSEVNISEGVVGSQFTALEGSVVNVSGGEIGSSFSAESGSEINITGGAFGDFFEATAGSKVTVSGGAFDFRFEARPGSDVELIGGEFELNGESFTGPTITLKPDDLFSGVLQDGSAFFTRQGIFNDVTLTRVPLPAVNTDPVLIDTVLPEISTVRQTITVTTGGEIGNLNRFLESTINIEDGVVGDDLAVFSGVLNISGGVVGESVEAFFDSEVNISVFAVAGNSIVNISGGEIGTNPVFSNIPSLDVTSNSVVNISGGVVGDFVLVFSGAELNISGGIVGSDLHASGEVNISSNVELIGGEFRLNGTSFNESTITLGPGDVFTGVLQDGSGFIFRTEDGDVLLWLTRYLMIFRRLEKWSRLLTVEKLETTLYSLTPQSTLVKVLSATVWWQWVARSTLVEDSSEAALMP